MTDDPDGYQPPLIEKAPEPAAFGFENIGLDLPMHSPHMSLAKAREEMAGRLLKGERVDCALCAAMKVIYMREVHDTMAIFLGRLVALFEVRADWYNLREVNGEKAEKASSDAAYFKKWALLETRRVRKTAQYRPTARGIAWVNDGTTIPQAHLHYNNKVLRWSWMTVTYEMGLTMPRRSEEGWRRRVDSGELR